MNVDAEILFKFGDCFHSSRRMAHLQWKNDYKWERAFKIILLTSKKAQVDSAKSSGGEMGNLFTYNSQPPQGSAIEYSGFSTQWHRYHPILQSWRMLMVWSVFSDFMPRSAWEKEVAEAGEHGFKERAVDWWRATTIADLWISLSCWGSKRVSQLKRSNPWRMMILGGLRLALVKISAPSPSWMIICPTASS